MEDADRPDYETGTVDMVDRSYNMAVIDGRRYLMDEVPGDVMDGSVVEYSSDNPRGLFPRVDIHRVIHDEPVKPVYRDEIPMVSTIVLGPSSPR
jgi:hypothetical protein